jgi:hypothetical protein
MPATFTDITKSSHFGQDELRRSPKAVARSLTGWTIQGCSVWPVSRLPSTLTGDSPRGDCWPP